MKDVRGIGGATGVPSYKQIIDMSDVIALLQPSAAPFMAFMKRAKGKTEKASNPVFNWMEDDLNATADAVNNAAGYLSTDISIVVDNGAYFRVNDVLKVPRTGEQMLVTGVATNTLTVKRGWGVTAAAALVDNDDLWIIANASAQGSGAPQIKTTTEIPVSNFTEIFKTAFGVTGTENATNVYGQKELSYQQSKAGIEHTRQIAQALWFGEKKQDSTGDYYQQSTGGFLSFCTANKYDATGALTQDEFDQNVMEQAFLYGGDTKLLFASARLLSVINGWALGKLQVRQGEDTFGLRVTEYVSPHGILQIVPEPLFKGAVYGGYGVIVDPANVKYRPLRDTQLETNIQANDADKRMDQYITEAGLEVRLPKTHMLLTGVTS